MRLVGHIVALLLLHLFPAHMQACNCKPRLVGHHLIDSDGACRFKVVECVMGATSTWKQARYEAELIHFLQNRPSENEAASTAVWLLGTMRSEKAIPCLVDQLEMDYLGLTKRLTDFEANPSTALIMIGKPSLEPLLDACSNASSHGTLQLIATMVVRICGGRNPALTYLTGQANSYPEANDLLLPIVSKLSE